MKALRCVVAVAVVGSLLAGCGGKSREESVADILIQRGASKEEIIKLSEKGVPYLKKLLKSQHESTRIVVCMALGQHRGDQEATEALLAHTKHQGVPDRCYALLGLAVQGAPEAKELIQKYFADPDPELRRTACAAIYELGDKSLYPLLTQALNDPDITVVQAATRFREMIRGGRDSP